MGLSAEQQQPRRPNNPHNTADDRFMFPPVPGYTGYVPRSREHFGKSYAVTTLAALHSFEELCESKSKLPPKVESLHQAYYQHAHNGGKGRAGTPIGSNPSNQSSSTVWNDAQVVLTTHLTGSADVSSRVVHSVPVRIRVNEARANIPTGHTSAAIEKRHRAAELQEQCANNHMFLPGYTGFIPRERRRFGEQYQKSATAAMSEFKELEQAYEGRMQEMKAIAVSPTPLVLRGPLELGAVSGTTQASPAFNARASSESSGGNNNSLRAIPGYTGYRRVHVTEVESGNLPPKDLAKTPPIPGYKGFLPTYQLCGQRSFGQTSKDCIRNYKNMLKEQELQQSQGMQF